MESAPVFWWNFINFAKILYTLDSRQFINIMAQRLNLETSTAEKLLCGFVEVIGEECGGLNRLALPSLGSFQGVKRDETVVRDLSTGRACASPSGHRIGVHPWG